MFSVNSLAEFQSSVAVDQCIALTFDSSTPVPDIKKLQATRWLRAPSCRVIKVSACHNVSSRTYHHKPFDLLDYDLDYTKFLTEGDSIASYEAISGNKRLSACTQDNVLKVWVSAELRTKRVVVRITSTYGVSKEFMIQVRVR